MRNFYANKKVLVTGHTGFKGSWLCSWLLALGAKVYGYSKDVPTSPSMYALSGMEKFVESYVGDILDREMLSRTISVIKPDIMFHIAAQPIVLLAHENPFQTFETNVMGTASVLEALRQLENPCSLVSITSDKSYMNKEWVWGYRETDELGGKDPYSASKAGAEMVLRAYHNTYFSQDSSKRVAVARAGNIIGGGDWAHSRIIPDCIRAWERKQAIIIRSPQSVRPWQHVMEPIYGYLLLAQNLYGENKFNGEAFNFGPSPMDYKDVFSLVKTFSSIIVNKGFPASVLVSENNEFNEAGLLKLNCEKALAWLKWKPILAIDEALECTASWYCDGYWNKTNIMELTQKQIAAFEQKMN